MAQMLHLMSGQARVRVDDTHHVMAPGDVIYIPAQTVHGFEFNEATEGRVLSFPLPVLHPLAKAAPALAARLDQPLCAAASDDLEALISAFAAGFETHGPLRAPRLVALAQALLCTLLEGAEIAETAPRAGSGDPQQHLRAFDELLRTHLGEHWSAQDYARALGMSRGHLSRLCRERRGIGTSRLIAEAEMTEACRLLAFTQLSMAQIGYRLGYDDPSHFSRKFKALRQESPSDYRQKFYSGG